MGLERIDPHLVVGQVKQKVEFTKSGLEPSDPALRNRWPERGCGEDAFPTEDAGGQLRTPQAGAASWGCAVRGREGQGGVLLRCAAGDTKPADQFAGPVKQRYTAADQQQPSVVDMVEVQMRHSELQVGR